MYTGKLVFAQVMEFLPMYEFQKCVKSKVSLVSQVTQKIKGGLQHKTIEQIIESTEMGENID